MKKIISVFLSLILLISLAVPALAAYDSNYRSEVPMILISGDGGTIVDADGNETFKFLDILKVFNKEDGQDDAEDSNVSEAAKNILRPLLLEGVLQNKWDNYYEALYKEIADIFDDIMLDDNGDPKNGTQISEWERNENRVAMTTDKAGWDGAYGFEDYHFWYDWRLDPLENADGLHEYIEAVKSVTGKQKVAVTSRCLGGNVLLAYIAKYGTDSLQSVGFDGATSNGSETISGVLSGDFAVDGNSIARFIDDSRVLGLFNVDPLISASLELLENSGVLDGMTAAARILIYNKIEKGVISALARATLFTMPCYWALVTADRYEKAKDYVFGCENDEKREKYAGLIAKLDAYDALVRRHIPELVSSVRESGANLCIISKYGAQIVPLIKNGDLISDQYASVTLTSLGATTSRIGETLPEDYIARRSAAGLGAYISPDKQIDASTCLFPDLTYFVKGIRHSDWSKVENDIMERVLTAGSQLTVNDLPYSQFIVAHTGSDDWEVMTQDNCHTENWSEYSSAGTSLKMLKKIGLYFRTLFNWLKMVFDKIRSVSSSPSD